MAPLITLITPTGSRPVSFSLCERMMASQTYKNVQWIIVDDTGDTKPTLGQDYLRGPLEWQPGINTQRFSLWAALPRVRGEYLFFIEDDDFYRNDYLEYYVKLFESGADIVGEANVKYYSLPHQCYKPMYNLEHTSLSATAIRVSTMVDTFNKALHSGEKFFDITLWEYSRSKNTLLFTNQNVTIGMKGLPGRMGIGYGHDPKGFITDTGGKQLREWVGAEWFRTYQPYLGVKHNEMRKEEKEKGKIK